MAFRDSFVCAECFADSGVREFIEYNEIKTQCSFCNGKPDDAPVAWLEQVMDHIKTCLYEEYDDAAGQLAYDEGEYIGPHWDTEELLLYVIGLDLPRDNGEKLLTELLGRLEDITWCEKDAYGLDDRNRARFSWALFCEVVMHRRRFFFSDYEEEPYDETYSPGEVLDKLFQDAERYDLFQVLPPETKLFRARFQKAGNEITTARDLGPPPKGLANQSNRMSPPGIPMFYACDSSETALRETANEGGQFTIGCFETRRPATILDLTDIPSVPSLLQAIPDSLEFRPREVLGFLNHVASEMSRPIQRDGRVHINYIPTQVVTEYIRSKLISENVRIDGIKYASAVHPGFASYVIFATQDDLLPAPEGSWVRDTDRWLELTSASEYSVTQKDIELWKEQLPKRYEGDYQQSLYGND